MLLKKRFFARSRCGLAGALVCAFSGGLRADALPMAPLVSQNGALSVYAPREKAGYRSPVFLFASRTTESFQRTVRLKLGTPVCPLDIVIGGQSDGDTRVLTGRLRDVDGRIRERIELPDPEAADLDRLRHAICVSLLRAWMVEAGGTEETLRDLPMWLIDGVVRRMDRKLCLADLDRALFLWSNACLPTASELVAWDSVAATREPAVAAVLADWALEKRPHGDENPFEALLRAAAHGTTWDPALAARLLSGTDDALRFDERLDFWLLAQGRQVTQPGVTTAGMVRRFRAHLLLYPADYDKTPNQRHAGLTFQEAVARAEEPAIRYAAYAQAAKLRVVSAGRDGTLLAVSGAYVDFLEALAKKKPAGELTRLLDKAEAMRRGLERETAGGAVLNRPGAEARER